MMFDNFNWINEGEIKIEENKAVSYTHLTLPTRWSV